MFSHRTCPAPISPTHKHTELERENLKYIKSGVCMDMYMYEAYSATAAFGADGEDEGDEVKGSDDDQNGD